MDFEEIDLTLIWTSREAENVTDMVRSSDHGDDWRPVIAAKIHLLSWEFLFLTKKKRKRKRKGYIDYSSNILCPSYPV